jgi:hypothetical protein
VPLVRPSLTAIPEVEAASDAPVQPEGGAISARTLEPREAWEESWTSAPHLAREES